MEEGPWLAPNEPAGVRNKRWLFYATEVVELFVTAA